MSIPVTLLTGFLGSGKTTLCNWLVRQPRMRDALVLINEVGEVAIDHHLVREIDERVVVLPSGCVCCALRDDLVEVLSDRRLMGDRSRVLVETSGLADPTPLLATLLKHPDLRDRFHLSDVMVTLDAGRASGTCARYPEAKKQLALADVVVITKCDLATADEIHETEALARRIAPDAALRHARAGVMGEPPPDVDSSRGRRRPDDSHAHSHGIATFAVESDSRTPYPELALWLSMMSQLNGEHLLRLKGIVHVTDHHDAVVVQAVQHVVYPSYTLPAWPNGRARTRLVGVTHGLSAAFHESMVASLVAIVGRTTKGGRDG